MPGMILVWLGWDLLLKGEERFGEKQHHLKKERYNLTLDAQLEFSVDEYSLPNTVLL